MVLYLSLCTGEKFPLQAVNRVLVSELLQNNTGQMQLRMKNTSHFPVCGDKNKQTRGDRGYFFVKPQLASSNAENCKLISLLQT